MTMGVLRHAHIATRTGRGLLGSGHGRGELTLVQSSTGVGVGARRKKFRGSRDARTAYDNFE